jgi:uncharacterized delta-60 repeat protein
VSARRWWLIGIQQQTRSGKVGCGSTCLDRRSRTIHLQPELLEDRRLLATSLLPGSLDPNFGEAGLVASQFSGGAGGGAAALQPDGKIVAIQAINSDAFTLGVGRFLPNGQPDLAFGGGGTVGLLDPLSLRFDDPKAVAIINDPGQPDDGKIVVAGTGTDPVTNQSGVVLVRLNADGSLDTGFGSSGVVLDTRTSDGAQWLVVQPDGKILVAGTTLVTITSHQGFVERFNADGSPDLTFANPGVASAPPGWTLSDASAIALGANGDIFVAGAGPAGNVDNGGGSVAEIAVAHLTLSGQLDLSFGSAGVEMAVLANEGLGDFVGLTIDPGRGLVVAATVVPPGTINEHAVVTLFDFRGNLDSSFDHGSVEFINFQPPGRSLDAATAVAVQSDGKVLVAGATVAATVSGFALARLNPDGKPDLTFGNAGVVVTSIPSPGTSSPTLSIPRSMILQADGDILLTGESSGPVLAMARYVSGIEATIAAIPPLSVGSDATTSATFADSISPGPYAAIWNWGDGHQSVGFVSATNGSGSIAGTHVYTAAGIYQVTLTVIDLPGFSSTSASGQIVAVYKPGGGSITGSGTIKSPPGSVSSNRMLTGKATFQLNARYNQNSGVPIGMFALNFQAANLSFRSTSLTWLAVLQGTAWFEETGTLGGAGSFGVLVSAVGGNRRTGKLRIRIWDELTGAVLHDTQPGAPIGAAPTTKIAGGSITVHLVRPQRRR